MTRDFFDAAAQRHSRRVYTFASYLLGDSSEAEDITQEVLMRFTRIFIPAVVLCFFIAIPVAAQGLGTYPVEELGILDPGTLEVDINLEGTTLQIAAGAMQDPQLRKLVSNLTRVRVQVGSAEDLDGGLVSQRIDDAVAQLEAKGWARIISVEDGREKIYVYSIDVGDGTIAGLTALVNAGDEEIVVANIVGSIDPVLLGTAMSKMHTMDLSQFFPSDTDDD